MIRIWDVAASGVGLRKGGLLLSLLILPLYIPVLVFGTADPLNPQGGGWVWTPVPHAKPSPAQTVADWAARLQCQGPPESESPLPGVQRQQWRDCSSGARLAWLSIDGLGHHWAGARPLPFPSWVVGPQLAAPKRTSLPSMFPGPGCTPWATRIGLPRASAQ